LALASFLSRCFQDVSSIEACNIIFCALDFIGTIISLVKDRVATVTTAVICVFESSNYPIVLTRNIRKITFYGYIASFSFKIIVTLANTGFI